MLFRKNQLTSDVTRYHMISHSHVSRFIVSPRTPPSCMHTQADGLWCLLDGPGQLLQSMHSTAVSLLVLASPCATFCSPDTDWSSFLQAHRFCCMLDGPGELLLGVYGPPRAAAPGWPQGG